MDRETRHTWQLTAASAAFGLVIAAGAAAVAGPWDSGQRTAEQRRAAAEGRPGDGHHARSGPKGALPAPAPSAPGVLGALEAHEDAPPGAVDGARTDSAPPPTTPGLASALEPLLDDPALGSLRTATVWDVATGREVFGTKARKAAVPASTIKLATGAAALSALGPEHRISTQARARPGSGEIFLVGGGDPTLSAKKLGTLARDVALELREAGVKAISLRYDTSRYSGPVLHSIGPNPNLAPVSPLMIDEARLDGSSHGTAPRSADPAAAAAREFAERLGKAGLKVKGSPVAEKAPEAAEQLAAVTSAPLRELVEQMLTHSDNDLAEALARQAALAGGSSASFSGAAKAVRAELRSLGLPLTGMHFADGSGISRSSQVSADLLVRLLVLASSPSHPELRPLLTGLPVAAFSGTLDDRYEQGGAGAGVVRAKTGTLTGVNTLAGTVVDADGRLLAFAFMANGTADRTGAQRALDRAASAIANCGCR